MRKCLDYALSVETADIAAFPTDELPAGYDYAAPGFATKKVKTTYVDDNGKRKTMTWPFSAPFNVVAE